MQNINFILLVDDDEICIFLHQTLIKIIDESLSIKNAFSAEAALNILVNEISLIKNQTKDILVITDLHLKDMSGIEMIEKFYSIKQPFNNQNRVLFCLTSNLYTAEDKIKALKLNLEVVDKPLTIQKLINWMNKLESHVQ